MADAPRFPHEKALAIARALDRAGIPHAFGGAIALAFAAEPRGTIDVDVNLFVSVSRADEVLAALRRIGVAASDPGVSEQIARDEQIRLSWDRTWIDLFFAYSALHDACATRTRTARLFDQNIRVLSPEDLAIFKVLFDRPKDWVDLESIVLTQADRFDGAYVERWVREIVGDEDPRASRLRELLARRMDRAR
jgi:hypothetical protein